MTIYMPTAARPAKELPMTEAERKARVDLAACYRIFDMLGWTEMIFNHITLRVPGPEVRFLINPFGLHYREVTASNLVLIDIDGHPLRGQEGRNHRVLLRYGLKRGRKRHPITLLLFGEQPCLACHGVPQLGPKALDLSAGPGVIQRDQRLSAVHDVAVGDQDIPDNAALEMLDRLTARFRLYDAGSDRRALERCEA